jgi:hypothetical protein
MAMKRNADAKERITWVIYACFKNGRLLKAEHGAT